MTMRGLLINTALIPLGHGVDQLEPTSLLGGIVLSFFIALSTAQAWRLVRGTGPAPTPAGGPDPL